MKFYLTLVKQNALLLVVFFTKAPLHDFMKICSNVELYQEEHRGILITKISYLVTEGDEVHYKNRRIIQC